MRRKHPTTLLLLGTLLLPATAALCPAAASPTPHDPGNSAAGENDPLASRTLAPYFSVGGTPAGAGLGLVNTKVRVEVTGTLADVVVEQTYANRGTTPIEAEYIFPASTRAAVHGMEMKVGDRVINAVIQEKAKAAAIYAAAKSEKKTAALLEQKRPNVFRMQVANIAPGESVAVTLHYSETISSTDRIHEFVFPTVVGPRYSVTPSNSEAGKADAWVSNPYLNPPQPGSDLPAAAAAPGFDINVRVRAGMPVQSMTCPTHETAISYPDAATTLLSLKPGVAAGAGNRDFVLRYQLAGIKVSSGLLLNRGEKENYFWLTLQPPARIAPKDVTPREYVFIIDVSGSMTGFPLDTAKDLLRNLLGGMGPADSFNVMLFSGAANVLSPTPLPADAANLQRALNLIDGQGAGGGTNLLPALEQAFALPGDDTRSRSIVLITDGFVDCEKRSFEIVRKGLGKANFFSFGIGSSVNRFLIEGLARAGRGEPCVVLDQAACAPAAKRFKEYIDAPVLTNVSVEFEGVETSAMEPWSIPDVFAERPVELFGKWTGEPRGKIRVRGIAGREPVSFEFDLAAAAAQGTDNPALATLWARQRVQRLGDDHTLDPGNGDLQKEITALGLEHHLLTEFTSFVAVDETPRPQLADAQRVTQPLPLPQGVSPAAVGGGGTAGTVPEPGGLLLIMIAAIAVLSGRVRSKVG